MRQVEYKDKIWVKLENNGYVGYLVAPGSADDNTQGNAGIHWEYLQYSNHPDIDDFREASLLMWEAEKADEKIKIQKELQELEAESEYQKKHPLDKKAMKKWNDFYNEGAEGYVPFIYKRSNCDI